MKCNRRHGDRPFLIYTSLIFGVLIWEKRQWGSKNISWWRMDRDRSHFGKEKYLNEEKSEIYIGLNYDWFELCKKLFPWKDPLPFHLLSRSLVLNSWKFTNSLEQKSIFAFYFFLSLTPVLMSHVYTDTILIISQKITKIPIAFFNNLNTQKTRKELC